MPMPIGAPTASAEQPRGDVTIDTRRRELIGVRVVRVEHTILGATVRTTGVVRYDETRQIDVNVKITSTIHVLIITPVIFYIRKERALRKAHSNSVTLDCGWPLCAANDAIAMFNESAIS